MYRLAYGNGQVSEKLATLAKAQEAYRQQVEYDRRHRQPYTAYLTIQRYEGDGEWSTVKKTSRDPVKGKRRKTSKRDPSTRKMHSEQWGYSSPTKIEDLLIEVSQRIQQADRALEEALPQIRLPDLRAQRSRVKNNIKYLQRLIEEMQKYIDKANQEIGF